MTTLNNNVKKLKKLNNECVKILRGIMATQADIEAGNEVEYDPNSPGRKPMAHEEKLAKYKENLSTKIAEMNKIEKREELPFTNEREIAIITKNKDAQAGANSGRSTRSDIEVLRDNLIKAKGKVADLEMEVEEYKANPPPKHEKGRKPLTPMQKLDKQNDLIASYSEDICELIGTSVSQKATTNVTKKKDIPVVAETLAPAIQEGAKSREEKDQMHTDAISAVLAEANLTEATVAPVIETPVEVSPAIVAEASEEQTQLNLAAEMIAPEAKEVAKAPDSEVLMAQIADLQKQVALQAQQPAVAASPVAAPENSDLLIAYRQLKEDYQELNAEYMALLDREKQRRERRSERVADF